MKSTLLTGKPYTSAVETDLRKTFARIRKQQALDREAQLARDDEAARERQKLDAKVRNISSAKS